MKHLILSSLAVAALLAFTGCETDDEATISTVTTEETSVSRPVTGVSTTTETVRTY